MTLPGFGAELALASEEDDYYVRRQRAGGARVTAAALPLWRPGDCIPCKCVTAEGCPCCGYEGTQTGRRWSI